MTTEHPPHPSKLFGTAGRAFRMLENEGLSVQDFLQRIIDEPGFRRQLVDLFNVPFERFTTLTLVFFLAVPKQINK